MFIYHALINALSVYMIHINLNMIFYTHVEHSPTKTIYIKYYKKLKNRSGHSGLDGPSLVVLRPNASLAMIIR